MQSKIKKPLFSRLFFYLFICTSFLYNGGVNAQSDPETKAKQLFESRKYEEALPVFEDLTRLYPSDPNLNYYYGACLIETGHFDASALNALKLAGSQQKSDWYLAQYYHANDQWAEAMTAYQQFKGNASSKELNTVSSLDEMMALCAQQINPYKVADEESPADTTQIIEEPTAMPAAVSTEVAFVEPELQNEEAAYADTLISFPVNAQISYLKVSQFKTDEARQDFLDARALEQELNEKLKTSKELRERYEAADDLVKMQLADSILQLEQDSYKLNQEIAQKDQSANLREASYWSSASMNEIAQFRATNQQLQDSIESARREAQIEAMQQAEIIVVEANDSIAIDTLQAEIEPVDEIIYRIQIGAYRNDPPDWVQRLFKKLSVLRRIDQYTDEQGVTVYTVGELKSYEDAQQMLKQIKLEGVSTATIAAYKNNERIPVTEARKLQQNGL
ncbi:SPOR domain-containing protein [Mangrovibacterium diazotrophicum]|uniref:Tetratricopeptide repeat protein n=1 Tax=Mangrovibacterium diazotrophicum TaxID=1261403 RepID=A0A419W5U4_9BACT|nr:SPOR domain-containing protein [Mangrovibacterium diazotrophicum]RKD90790.1 tetratricopeptide repeat protein [Mangrovibacterium diazotrophicum]